MLHTLEDITSPDDIITIRIERVGAVRAKIAWRDERHVGVSFVFDDSRDDTEARDRLITMIYTTAPEITNREKEDAPTLSGRMVYAAFDPMSSSETHRK